MNKNIKLLAIIFAVLLIIAFLPIIKNNFVKDQPKTVKKSSVDLSGFSKETIQKVTIKLGEETKTLTLSGETWKINNEDADQAQIEMFFDGLAEAQVIKLVSKNQENHEKFAVTKEAGTLLTFTGEDGDTTFFVGKQGPELDSFYLRKEGIANVYLVRGNVQDKVAQDVSEWKPAPKEETDGTNSEVKMEDIIEN